jgi:hypothetical protein
MGYCVTLISSTAKIKPENQAEAYRRMCELNTTHDDQKNGGHWEGGKYTQRWFSWMAPDYPEKCKTAADILHMLGFEVEQDEEGDNILYIHGYDSKTGQEDLFLEAIGDLIEGKMEWCGEDDTRWKLTFGPKGMKYHEGRVVYED